MTLVLAHAGHWLEGVAFGGPVVATPLFLALFVRRERKRERAEEGVNSGSQAPPSVSTSR